MFRWDIITKGHSAVNIKDRRKHVIVLHFNCVCFVTRMHSCYLDSMIARDCLFGRHQHNAYYTLLQELDRKYTKYLIIMLL